MIVDNNGIARDDLRIAPVRYRSPIPLRRSGASVQAVGLIECLHSGKEVREARASWRTGGSQKLARRPQIMEDHAKAQIGAEEGAVPICGLCMLVCVRVPKSDLWISVSSLYIFQTALLFSLLYSNFPRSGLNFVSRSIEFPNDYLPSA